MQSLNTKEDLSIDAVSYFGINSYGKVIIGDKAFEYYNNKNINDFIQIPYSEIEYISASVLFNKYINRFAIFTKRNGNFSFSTKNNKKTLNILSNYIEKNRIVKSLSFIDVVKNGIKSFFKK